MRSGSTVRLSLCLAAGLPLLAACVSHDMSDLEQYVQSVLARPGGRIKPPPEIKPYEPYTYKSGDEGKPDPFEPFYQVKKQEVAAAGDTGLSKEMEAEIKSRNREELEQFELDSLRMVGTIEDQDQHWAIILDPNGVVHRVTVGNYMGRNIGKITNIFEDRIELREIVQSSDGRWEERPAAVALVE